MFLILILPAIIALIVSALISFSVQKKLVQSGNKNPKTISIIIFIISAILIFIAIVALILYNIRFER